MNLRKIVKSPTALVSLVVILSACKSINLFKKGGSESEVQATEALVFPDSLIENNPDLALANWVVLKLVPVQQTELCLPIDYEPGTQLYGLRLTNILIPDGCTYMISVVLGRADNSGTRLGSALFTSQTGARFDNSINTLKIPMLPIKASAKSGFSVYSRVISTGQLAFGQFPPCPQTGPTIFAYISGDNLQACARCHSNDPIIPIVANQDAANYQSIKNYRRKDFMSFVFSEQHLKKAGKNLATLKKNYQAWLEQERSCISQ